MALDVTFNNISVISWWRKLEYPEKSTDLPQVTDILYHIILYRAKNNISEGLSTVITGDLGLLIAHNSNKD